MTDLTPRTVANSEVRSTVLVSPQEANIHNNLFGGALVAHIDRLSAMTSIKHCRGNVVTASIDRLDFVAPVKVGCFVHFHSRLAYVGRTSMEILVDVHGEEPFTGRTFKVCDAQLTFVALGEDGRPTPVPPIVPETDAEHADFERGQTRAIARKRAQ